jgi:enoyl-CoA hydratase/carnithine racemase
LRCEEFRTGPHAFQYNVQAARLTGQKLSAREALTLGVVSEIVARDKLLPQAWELAEHIAKRPRLASRYARVALTQPIKRALLDNFGCGLTLERLAMSALRPPKS